MFKKCKSFSSHDLQISKQFPLTKLNDHALASNSTTILVMVALSNSGRLAPLLPVQYCWLIGRSVATNSCRPLRSQVSQIIGYL